MEWYAALTSMEKFYALCALLGGALFLVRTVLLLAGHAMEADTDISNLETHGDADASFKFLSLQSLTAFFMMFGLVALALSKQSKVAEIWAIGGGFLAGAATVWLVGRIFLGMKKLQSDGTLHIENAIGQEGSIYLRIPAGGTGKVQVAFQGRLAEYPAAAANGEELKSGERIKVVRVSGTNTLVVEKVQ